MQPKTRKYVLTVVKLALAGVLLGWVLSQVHWNDYVTTVDGDSYELVDRRPPVGPPRTFVVRTGSLWWARRVELSPERVVPIAGTEDAPRYVRTGFASSFNPQTVRPVLLTLGVLGFGLVLPIIAVRLRWLLTVQDIHIRPWEMVRLTFLGQFFNTVVPGTVGGDIVKAWYLSRHTPKKAAVLLMILVDRFAGLVELTLLSTVVLTVVAVADLEAGIPLRIPALAVGAVILAGSVFLLVLTSHRLRRALRLERVYRRLPLAKHFEAAGEAAVALRGRLGVLAGAVGITVVAHICWIGSIYLTGEGLGLPVPAYRYVLYVPLIYMVGAVPVTPGGVGLVEQFYVLLFATGQATASQALALALVARLTPILWGLPGLVVAATGPRLPETGAMEAELGLAREPAS